MAKRGQHNLDKIVPPTFAQVPLVPLTDAEIIVFFFNSLARPVVSLRLYARGWGPLQICEILNSHRAIEPEYLRNTCSVKCTTAIKKGTENYGEKWVQATRQIFADIETCTDIKATDMIRLMPDELDRAVDYNVRDLCNGLSKFPGEDDGGIFTRCVKWCHDNNAAYKLSNVWELASDLNDGRPPRRVVSNESNSSSGSSLFVRDRDAAEAAEENEDDLAASRGMRAGSEDSVMEGY